MLEEVFNTVSIVMPFPHVTIPLQVNFIYPSVNTDSKSIYLSVVQNCHFIVVSWKLSD